VPYQVKREGLEAGRPEGEWAGRNGGESVQKKKKKKRVTLTKCKVVYTFCKGKRLR